MTFEIKGDYFHSNFYLPPTKGLDSSYVLLEKINPADYEDLLWKCPTDSRHIPPVIESAKKGFAIWKSTSIEERISKIKLYIQRIDDRKNEIANAISLETGRPSWETLLEVKQTIHGCNITIENSKRQIDILNISSKELSGASSGTIIHRPIGPTLIISSYCSPFILPNNQIISSLLAGNSIVLKSSPEVCYTSQLIIECFHAAEFPLGVINCIQGNSEIGKRILKEKTIKGVFFIGSNEVGQNILETTHKDLHKIVSLNLGSKNTTILHKDINIDEVINHLLISTFSSSGQNCRSTSLIAIHHDIHEEFINKFHSLAKKIIIDHPTKFEHEPFMGALIDQKSVDNYILFIGMAKREGFDEIMRGKQIDKKFRGNYVTPSIHFIDSFNTKSHFLNTELLAPTSTFIPYRDIEEAINMTNSSEFGLVSSIYTNDKSIKTKCSQELQTGIININLPTTSINQNMPYGGIKNSGNNRPLFTKSINSCVSPLSILEKNNTSPSIELVGLTNSTSVSY